MRLDAPLRRRLGLGLLGVVLLGALAYVVLRSGPLAATRVTVQTVQSASLAPALFGIGTVEARRAYLIGPTTAARVLKVVVDVGDPVQAGQLLAEIGPGRHRRTLGGPGCVDRARRQCGGGDGGAAQGRAGQEGFGGHQRASLCRPGRQEFHQRRRPGRAAAGADLGRCRRRRGRRQPRRGPPGHDAARGGARRPAPAA